MEFHICLPWELDRKSKVRKSSCQMPHPADFVLSIQAGQRFLNLESIQRKTRYMLDMLHSFSRTVKDFTTPSQSAKSIRAPFMSSWIFPKVNADGECLPRTAMLNRNFLGTLKGSSSQPWDLAITCPFESHRMHPLTNRGTRAPWYWIKLSPRSQ
jgi:DNA-directed RNA polymerase subunit L